MLVGAALALVVPSVAVAQQDVRPLLERMERLERDLNTLQRQVYRGEGGATAAPAQAQTDSSGFRSLPDDMAGRLQVRIADLENLVTELTGRVEQTQFQVRRTGDRLDQLVRDIDFRLTRLEGGEGAADAASSADAAGPQVPLGAGPAAGAAGASGAAAGANAAHGTGQGILGVISSERGSGGDSGTEASSPLVATQPAPDSEGGSSTTTGSVRDQYDAAFALLRRGNYAEAEQALSGFLERHGDHELAGNAQYWLGETHYVRGDFQRAAVAFLDGYQTYPGSSKAPDNLLKLGMAMGRLDRTAEACTALQRLSAEYPQAPEAIKRRAAAEREQLGCS